MLVAVAAGMLCGLAAASEEADTRVLRRLLQRVQALDFENAQAVFEVAEWARRRDLDRYALELYHRALDADPLHEPAVAALREVAAEQGLVDDAELRQELAEAFALEADDADRSGGGSGGFRLYETDHFLVVHDADAEAARETGRLLERTHDVFFQAFEVAGIPPRPLRQRLAVILFADREDFATYARETDGVEHAWSLGHYSARTNRVALFEEAAASGEEAFSGEIDELSERAQQAERAIERARQRRDAGRVEQLSRSQSQIERRIREIEARRERLAVATETARVTHEASHQLAFNTGLLRRGVVYPVWILEGMATNFEAARPDGPFGPHVENDYRLAALIDARQRRAVLPLEELATQVELPADSQAVKDVYAQSYALFRFVQQRRPEQLRAYLARLYTLPVGEHDEAALWEAFEEAFDDVQLLQRQFDGYVRSR